MTEFWNLYLDKTYRLSRWPWPDVEWDAVTESHVIRLPHGCEDFLRYCPDDGTAGMSQVPAELPREWPSCRTAMAIYHDSGSVYIFLNAFRPHSPIPELADNVNEDFGCYFAMDGQHRGLYFGLNQNSEPICLAKVWDKDFQGQNDHDEFPWSQFKDDPWKPLEVSYQTRIVHHSEGLCALLKIDKEVIEKGIRVGRIGFTIGRRCYATAELVSWGSNLMWETRHDELGWLEFGEAFDGPGVPMIDRIDVEYEPAAESGSIQVCWSGVWDESRHHSLKPGNYNNYLGQYSIALNGREQTADIQPGTRNKFSIRDGWNRLEVMNAVGQKATVLSFQKFSGNSVVSGIFKEAPKPPGRSVERLVMRWRASCLHSLCHLLGEGAASHFCDRGQSSLLQFRRVRRKPRPRQHHDIPRTANRGNSQRSNGLFQTTRQSLCNARSLSLFRFLDCKLYGFFLVVPGIITWISRYCNRFFDVRMRIIPMVSLSPSIFKTSLLQVSDQLSYLSRHGSWVIVQFRRNCRSIRSKISH